MFAGDQRFRFGLIALPDTGENVARNAPLLGISTLGVEVTVPALAARCGLGNIDPQHGQGRGGPGDARARAAIEAALVWPPPPPGAILVTVRPDVDAVGAMAVLSLRGRGGRLDEGGAARVDLVARIDSFEMGGWREWVAHHQPLAPDHVGTIEGPTPTPYRVVAQALREQVAMGEKVAVMSRWLSTGDSPPAAARAVAAFDADLGARWRAGEIIVSEPIPGALAHVQSAHPGASAIGYRYAPVIILEGAVAGLRKLTIAQFEAGHLDMGALSARLNVIEPGWGGSATILGSPQGRASTTEIAEIVGILTDMGVKL